MRAAGCSVFRNERGRLRHPRQRRSTPPLPLSPAYPLALAYPRLLTLRLVRCSLARAHAPVRTRCARKRSALARLGVHACVVRQLELPLSAEALREHCSSIRRALPLSPRCLASLPRLAALLPPLPRSLPRLAPSLATLPHSLAASLARLLPPLAASLAASLARSLPAAAILLSGPARLASHLLIFTEGPAGQARMCTPARRASMHISRGSSRVDAPVSPFFIIVEAAAARECTLLKRGTNGHTYVVNDGGSDGVSGCSGSSRQRRRWSWRCSSALHSPQRAG